MSHTASGSAMLPVSFLNSSTALSSCKCNSKSKRNLYVICNIHLPEEETFEKLYVQFHIYRGLIN